MPEKTLIKSTSGVRGIVGNGLDPIVVTNFAAAFGTFLKKGKENVEKNKKARARRKAKE